MDRKVNEHRFGAPYKSTTIQRTGWERSGRDRTGMDRKVNEHRFGAPYKSTTIQWTGKERNGAEGSGTEWTG